jgi:hypothetical protein
MRERFTEAAKAVVQAANREAMRLQHEYIGPQHLLSALIEERDGVACQAFGSLGVDPAQIRKALDNWNSAAPTKSAIPRLKKTIEYAIEEARKLHHNYVSTEHLLLGLLRDREASAADLLVQLGINIEALRSAIIERIPPGTPADIVRREALELRLQNHPSVQELKKQIETLQSQIEEAIGKRDFRAAASCRDQRYAVEGKLEELYATFEREERSSGQS